MSVTHWKQAERELERYHDARRAQYQRIARGDGSVEREAALLTQQAARRLTRENRELRAEVAKLRKAVQS